MAKSAPSNPTNAQRPHYQRSQSEIQLPSQSVKAIPEKVKYSSKSPQRIRKKHASKSAPNLYHAEPRPEIKRAFSLSSLRHKKSEEQSTSANRPKLKINLVATQADGDRNFRVNETQLAKFSNKVIICNSYLQEFINYRCKQQMQAKLEQVDQLLAVLIDECLGNLINYKSMTNSNYELLNAYVKHHVQQYRGNLGNLAQEDKFIGETLGKLLPETLLKVHKSIAYQQVSLSVTRSARLFTELATCIPRLADKQQFQQGDKLKATDLIKFSHVIYNQLEQVTQDIHHLSRRHQRYLNNLQNNIAMNVCENYMSTQELAKRIKTLRPSRCEFSTNQASSEPSDAWFNIQLQRIISGMFTNEFYRMRDNKSLFAINDTLLCQTLYVRSDYADLLIYRLSDTPIFLNKRNEPINPHSMHRHTITETDSAQLQKVFKESLTAYRQGERMPAIQYMPAPSAFVA